MQELDGTISNLLNAELYREFREKKIKISREEFLRLNPFHWGFEFYDAFDLDKPKEERGFDVVIGNPPWGSKFEFISSEIVDKFLRLPVKNVNIFSVFLYYTFKQLNSDGRLGYLIPKVFVKNKAYTFYRTSLVRKIERIADWGKFPGVASETISIIASGRALDNGIVIVDEFLAEKHETNRVPIESILENKECILSLYLDENKWKIIKSIEVNSKLLSNYFDIKRGMEFGQSGELIFCENCKNYSEKPAKVYKQTELKECPFCKQKIVIKESKSRPLVSKVKQGDFMEPVLTGRCIDAWAIKENLFISPDLPGINYKKELMDGPRILVQRISDKIKATYNAGDSYLLNTVYALMTKDKNRTRCFIILDILNSKLMDFYYEYRYNIGMSLTTQVTIDFLKNIPITLPASQQSFIYLCKYMLFLNETEERRKNEEELIDFIDKQVIDALVCELYFGEKFKEDDLKPNLHGLVEPYLKDIENLKTEEEKLKGVKEVVEKIKKNGKVMMEIERIKEHEWVKVMEGNL